MTRKSSTRSSSARRRRPRQARPPRRTPAPHSLTGGLIVVAGRGRLGRSLAGALSAAGHQVRLVAARSGPGNLVKAVRVAPGALVFLTVPDDAVRPLAAGIARARPRVDAATSFVHVSGAHDLDALRPLASRHAVGSFHPLQSFPSRRPPDAFRGITIALDAGSAQLMRRLNKVARELGGRPTVVGQEHRVLYHAAAVFASNYVDSVIREAVALLEVAGWSEKEATRGLLPLVMGAVDNIRERGTVAALTGPIRRGDVATIRRHLDSLQVVDSRLASRSGPPFGAVYRMLGAIALEIAKEAGLEPAAAERVHRALTRTAAATRRRGRR